MFLLVSTSYVIISFEYIIFEFRFFSPIVGSMKDFTKMSYRNDLGSFLYGSLIDFFFYAKSFVIQGVAQLSQFEFE